MLLRIAAVAVTLDGAAATALLFRAKSDSDQQVQNTISNLAGKCPGHRQGRRDVL